MADDIRDLNPSAEHYIPIFEMNGETVYAFDSHAGKFIEYYYVDENAKIIGDNYQQFIGSLFVDLVDAGLYSLVIEVADLFDFKFMQELREFSEQDDDLSFADAKREFIERL